MRILVTGATGLIGREVGKRLVQNGHEINVVSRNPSRARHELPFPATCFAWKGDSEPFPREALAGVEGVVHLAGEAIADGRWTEERKKKIRDSRIEGTKRLVDAIIGTPAVLAKMKVFVLGSAVGFYGDRADEVLDEAAPAGTGFLPEVVRDWEEQVQPLREASPVTRVPIVRTGIVLSRRGGALAKMLPVFSKGLGGKLGQGSQWMSWVHIDDIARLFTFCVDDEGTNGVVNGTAPEPVRNDRFTIELARALAKPVFLPVPGTALKIAFGELAETLLGGQRVLPKRTQEMGFRFDHPDFVKAIRELCEPLQNGQHEFVAEQWVPKSPAEIFPFFSLETNLEKLTPPFLSFKVVSKSTDEVKEGTLIDYKLSLHGVPVTWRTRIESWNPGVQFVDTQLKGPYRMWHHTHDFIPLAGGTLIRDRVLYKLPLGLFGDVAAGWKVIGDVTQIFDFRRGIINDLFGVRA